MEIEFKFLNKSYIETIHQTMMEAFTDYQIDMSYMTLDRFIKRAKLGRVDFESSVGAFSGKKLVGFTNIGIDIYKEGLSAYDAGTGIIPEYRGKGIAGKMFDFAIPKLKEKGVKKFYLEVLQENKAAIRAYEKTGFKIEREYNCYKVNIETLKINKISNTDLKIRTILQEEVKKYSHFFGQINAWESNIQAIEHATEDIIILGAFEKNSCSGLISFYPTLEWIMVLGGDKTQPREKIESLLFNSLVEKIKNSVSIIKMGNVVPENPLNEFLLKQGFFVYAKQFEMICELE